MHYVLLTIAIIAEVAATTALAKTAGFTKLAPTLACLFFYFVAFACLAQVVKIIPVGIAYAIWCGAGVVLVAGLGWVLYQQKLDMPAIIGISLILIGTIIINLFSNSVSH
ncbi:SMR family transporter [Photobacterium makurazakiensis]|uniref:SMR family transporter n=1 Tax=Photobacterium makurazakiensis TaxID=2910234 RepID=UPI003D0E9D4D